MPHSIPLPCTASGRASFIRGCRLALPVVLGYLPVGFAFGVLASKAGLTLLVTMLMSLFVYAGSAQLIAVDLISAGASVAAVIMTTFVVNLRHLLMSAAVAPHLRAWSRLRQALFSAQMTDEAFAVDMALFHAAPADKNEVLGLHMTAHLAWISGGTLGFLFGDLIGDVRPWGLDFALPAMFLALLWPHLRIPPRLLAAVLAGGFSVAFSLAGGTRWSVILATASAATLVILLPEQNAQKQEAPHA